jgi:hypothetical protein
MVNALKQRVVQLVKGIRPDTLHPTKPRVELLGLSVLGKIIQRT